MDKKQQIFVAILIVFVLALPILALILSKKQAKKAQLFPISGTTCQISFSESHLPAALFKKNADNDYQVKPDPANNSQTRFKIKWNCGVDIASYRIFDGTTDISAKCQDNFWNTTTSQVIGEACTQASGCLVKPLAITPPTGQTAYNYGESICRNFPVGTSINVKVIFTPK